MNDEIMRVLASELTDEERQRLAETISRETALPDQALAPGPQRSQQDGGAARETDGPRRRS